MCENIYDIVPSCVCVCIDACECKSRSARACVFACLQEKGERVILKNSLSCHLH